MTLVLMQSELVIFGCRYDSIPLMNQTIDAKNLFKKLANKVSAISRSFIATPSYGYAFAA